MTAFIELKRLSTTSTLASLATSSTVTAYAADSDEQVKKSPAQTALALSEDASDGCGSDICYPTNAVGGVLFSQNKHADPAVFLQAILDEENDSIRQQDAVVATNTLIRAGRHDNVARAIAQLSDMGSVNTLLKRLSFRSQQIGPVWREGPHHQFLVALLQHCWNRLDFNSAEEICEFLRYDCPLLRFMFPLPEQNQTAPPQHIHIIFTYFSLPRTAWPSLGSLEEGHFLQLPSQWPISGLVHLLPKCDSSAMTALVNRLIASTKPNAQLDPTGEDIAELIRLTAHDDDRPQQQEYKRAEFLARHPVAPYLWLSVYLAHGNDAAARALLEGGIVDNVRSLYDLDFPDPRLSDEQLTDVVLQSYNDLLRLCYMLLRVLIRSAKGKQRSPVHSEKKQKESPTYTRALEEAESLGQFLREDLRCYGRMLSARYHDAETVYRDELAADMRDRLFLQGN